MKKENSKELNLNKFIVAAIDNPDAIKGGTDGNVNRSSFICTN